MTLVIAALATDGVVFASDTREIMEPSVGTYRDGAKKCLVTPGGVLVGFDGPGQWAKGLIANLTNAGKLATHDPHDVASEIHTKLLSVPLVPDIQWLIGGCSGTPSIYIVTRKRVGGVMKWATPLDLATVGWSFTCAGINVFANSMLGHWHNATADVDEVAALAAATMKQTMKTTCFVGGEIRLSVVRCKAPPWSEEQSEKALKRADDFLEKLGKQTP